MQVIASCKAIAKGQALHQLNCLTGKYRFTVRIMKLTAIILLGACLQLSARGLSQSITLSLKDAPIKSLFKEIERQTDYTFFFDEELLQKGKKVTIVVKGLPLNQVLDLCFKDQPFTYLIDGKTITIAAKKNEKNESTGIINAPAPIDVSGKVTDESGSPLVGANVVEKGTSHGTSTNADGVFVLKGVDENGTLEISYIGYQTLVIPINKRTSIFVSIKQSDASLQEVVINKGYYTEAKRFSTGNAAQVSSKELEQQPVQNPLLALEGRVPGLVVTQLTGINGGGVQVRIQGQNSFNSGLEPLIVIDGIPFPSQFSSNYMETIVAGGSPLNYINMSDIESISVLKDADATAIYGSRAANGAILITTKKAKAGKLKLSVEAQQGWGKVTHFAKMMNTRQYLDMRYEAYKNDGINLTTQSVGFNNYDLKLWDTTRYTNWQKELIGGTAKYTNINANVSGGTATVQYLVGANFNRQTTVFPGDFDDKAYGMHFNLNGNSLNQRFHIQLSGSYTYNQNQLPGIDLTRNAILLEPDAPKLYNNDGLLNWESNASGSSTWDNPLAKTFSSEFNNITKNLLANMNIGYTILQGLVFSSNFGYTDIQSNLFKGLRLEYVKPESRPFFQRQATFGTRDLSSYIIEPQLQFKKNVAKGKFEALLGTTIQKSSGKYLIVETSGQPSNELLHTLTAATSIRGVNIGSAGDFVTRFNGLFGRLNYNWNKKYLINITSRRDGSSKFGDENKFHNFWSAGIAWIFSEEKWIQKAIPIINFGKLRTSYGTTGNDQIADYSYLSLYSLTNTNIPYQAGTGFFVNGLSNPSLQWEETRKWQGGIDFAILKERIAFGVTYARNRSSNQLVNYSLPNVAGFGSFIKNFPATIQNTSLELYLNTINIKIKDLTWSTSFNLTIPRNKIFNFPGIELTSYASGFQGVIIGEPIGVMKLWQYGGVDPTTGNYMLLDKDGKPVPNPSANTEQNIKVSTLPNYYGGLTNTFSYKGFQLDFLFQFVRQIGSKDLFYKAESLAPGAFFSGLSNQPVSVLNRWQKSGDNSTIGRYTTSYSFNIWPYYYTSEGYSYEAGSYIRLKNVLFSWQLPDYWTHKAHLQTARIYFRGQNLATITKYTGIDPESRSINNLPPLQTWTLGMKIEL